MTGHIIGVAFLLVGFVAVTAAAFGLFGYWGLGAAGIGWLVFGGVMVRPEVLYASAT